MKRGNQYRVTIGYKRILLLMGLICSIVGFGQENSGYEKMWSMTDRLTESDFKLDVGDSQSQTCYAQFSMNYSVGGLSFFAKNFNQKVTNVMLTNASWINKYSPDSKHYIRYQQILFDLSEIYSREFRKRLLINKRKLAKGPQIAEDIQSEVLKELSEERARFIQESNSGVETEAMKKWEKEIIVRLSELNEFRYENEEKIKIEQ